MCSSGSPVFAPDIGPGHEIPSAGARRRDPYLPALGSALLLAMFGTAMAISFGLKSPMDYSVFSASGAAGLLTWHAFSQHRDRALQKRN